MAACLYTFTKNHAHSFLCLLRKWHIMQYLFKFAVQGMPYLCIYINQVTYNPMGPGSLVFNRILYNLYTYNYALLWKKTSHCNKYFKRSFFTLRLLLLLHLLLLVASNRQLTRLTVEFIRFYNERGLPVSFSMKCGTSFKEEKYI